MLHSEFLSVVYNSSLICIPLAFTPGPNNILLANSGRMFGYKRCIHMVFALLLGVSIIFILASLGITSILNNHLLLKVILIVSGLMFLMYLSIKILFSKPININEQKTSNPLSFLKMFLFQFTNIKTLIAMSTVISLFIQETTIKTILYLFPSIMTISFVSAFSWLILGSSLSKILSKNIYHRIFNVTMSLILIYYVIILIPYNDINTLIL